jgi:3alpha(or 20beta)-hydroxysteroid dehydrogenase
VARLSGKVVLITGAAQSLGAHIASAFVDAGAEVIITDIAVAEGAELVARLGKNASFTELDVRSPSAWESAIALTEDTFGHLDVLVNNAAVVNGQKLVDATLDTYMETIMIGQVGPFLGTKYAIDPLRRAGGGSIINIGTVDAILPPTGITAYASAKWALRALTRIAAGELAEFGIRVNSVHFGTILETSAIERNRGKVDFEKYAELLPMKRFGQPAEVSAMVTFLASDESAFCTGADYMVDGGRTAVYPLPR